MKQEVVTMFDTAKQETKDMIKKVFGPLKEALGKIPVGGGTIKKIFEDAMVAAGL